MDPLQNHYPNDPPLEALPFYPWQIILIVVYSTTAFISLGSNVLTIIILVRGEHVSTELWKFLLNLSISDITMAAFCIPFTYTQYMLGRWIFPRFLCPIIPFFQVTSVSVSIWTLTIIGIDRFFAIIYPFRSMLWLRRHKITTIAGLWILGSLIGSPELYYSRIKPFKYGGQEHDDCREHFTEEGSKNYTIFIFLFTFFIPIVALIFVYARICIHLIRNSSAPGNPDQHRDKVCIGKKIKVIKMLVTIVVLFAMCWFPIHLFQLLFWFCPSIQNQKTTFSYYVYVGSYFLCHWLAMAHSFVNPFVYCFMSDNFRQSLRKTLSKCFPHKFAGLLIGATTTAQPGTTIGPASTADGASITISGGNGRRGFNRRIAQTNSLAASYDDDDDDYDYVDDFREDLTLTQIQSTMITTIIPPPASPNGFNGDRTQSSSSNRIFRTGSINNNNCHSGKLNTKNTKSKKKNGNSVGSANNNNNNNNNVNGRTMMIIGDEFV